jgi:peptidoglycan/xylan/chitin deacetylase (PgdA/CDA1 family)
VVVPDIGLLFHGIGTPGRDLEPGEAHYWIPVERFEAILDQVQALPHPHRIHISFDDGNASDHDIALPALQARGLRADFFVLSGRIDQPGSLSAGQIRALAGAGMGVGSHGIAHVNWSRLPAAALVQELATSRHDIAAILGRPVDVAGIPFGAWNGRVLRALSEAGYRIAYSSDRGMMNPDAFLRPRTSVTVCRSHFRARDRQKLVPRRVIDPHRRHIAQVARRGRALAPVAVLGHAQPAQRGRRPPAPRGAPPGCRCR